eukprot:GAHX01008549.1.p1 GENE.GAHX01008549.1~~GAHX01008549.1.p1  ORF type:complete len:63 (-),score=4.40 GAHX01008549.1:6-194(-)
MLITLNIFNILLGVLKIFLNVNRILMMTEAFILFFLASVFGFKMKCTSCLFLSTHAQTQQNF